MEVYSIDRFESGFAVIESSDGKIFNIPIKLISGNAREGDVLVKVSENVYKPDKFRTANERSTTSSILQRLKEKSKI